GAWLREFLQELPSQVDFAERAAAEPEGEAVQFAAPDGYSVDPAQLELHKKILAYAEEHNIDYAEAALAVGGNQ
ncbi:MAG: peptidase, partial [Gammaproteobacteria bacterium]